MGEVGRHPGAAHAVIRPIQGCFLKIEVVTKIAEFGRK